MIYFSGGDANGTRVAVLAVIVREGSSVQALNELLHRYGAEDVGPGKIAWGGESIFDPVHSRIVAEVHIGDRALVVVGRPVAAGSGQFSTYDFEFFRDDDRWWLIDIAVVDGFDRLSMLKRRRARAH